jgi:hypothetical protein
MLTALLDALINFIGVLVGWLVDVAVALEATPFSFAWPLLLALLLQVLLAAVSGWCGGRGGWYGRSTAGIPRPPPAEDPATTTSWANGVAVASTDDEAGSAAPTPTSSLTFTAGKRSTTTVGLSSAKTQAVAAFFDSTQNGSACSTIAAGRDHPRIFAGCSQW